MKSNLNFYSKLLMTKFGFYIYLGFHLDKELFILVNSAVTQILFKYYLNPTCNLVVAIMISFWSIQLQFRTAACQQLLCKPR